MPPSLPLSIMTTNRRMRGRQKDCPTAGGRRLVVLRPHPANFQTAASFEDKTNPYRNLEDPRFKK